MNRKEFLKISALLPLTGLSMKLSSLANITDKMEKTDIMPSLFLGHGSPMNAIEENEFVDGFRKIASKIPKPKAILCVSAHWETNGTFITAMNNPRTIHDFGGFPKELFEIQYPAPGNPELAESIKNDIKKTVIGLDQKWGLDHGAWSVVKHLYPNAEIPVLQFSIDRTKPAIYHYELSKELKKLRERGILIIGSGNMVHNLRKVAWDKLNTSDYAYDWTLEASSKMKEFLMKGDFLSLVNYHKQGKSFELAIPTPEHYLPMIYTLGTKKSNENIEIFNDKAVGGSLTMTSFRLSE
jgi:4,5-DOPA dioxygenase extradiol